MNVLGKTRMFTGRVDDTLGVFHTHGVAGAFGELMTGVFASPNMIVYVGTAGTASVAVTGLVYGNQSSSRSRRSRLVSSSCTTRSQPSSSSSSSVSLFRCG